MIVALAVFMLMSQKFGWTAAVALLGVAAIAAPPRALVQGQIFGLSLTPVVFASVVLALIGLLSLKRGGISLRFVPFLIFLLLIGGLAWQPAQGTTAGLALLVLAVIAWAAGSVASGAVTARPVTERALVVIILLLVGLQAGVTVLQTLGFDIFSAVSESGELTEGRASGMFGHPGTLGKNIVLLVFLVVPLTVSRDTGTRRLAYFTVILAIVPVGLSESRSNFAALIALILTWALLIPRGKGLSGRVALPAAMGIVALMFYDVIAARFLNDPGGGQRGHFMEVALTHIPDNLLLGVGPSGYIPYFGQFDALTAEGWPVHNAFVLMLAETGLLGALLIFVPLLLAPALRASRLLRDRSTRGIYARVFVATLPAIVILGTTGWGLVGAVIFPVFTFALGYLSRGMNLEANVITAGEADALPGRERASTRPRTRGWRGASS